MPALTASAPGKIILFGEHAVVYGQPAIAVPVNQIKARAVINPDLRGSPGEVHIQAPDVNLDSRLDDLPGKNPIAEVVRATIKELGISQPPAFRLRITSTIPLAAGLGSGAAVSVAVIRVVSAFLGKPLPDDRVSALAYEIEKIHHGTPSGIDNTVITYASPVFFIRERLIETLPLGCSYQFMIADTGITSPTAVTVGEVRRKWEENPVASVRIFEAIGALVQIARQELETGGMERIGGLMDENHNWLQELGVSSLALDRLVIAAREAGALGAKLSGGGRGGNIIALVPPGMEERVAHALHSAGAVRTFLTVLKKSAGEP